MERTPPPALSVPSRRWSQGSIPSLSLVATLLLLPHAVRAQDPTVEEEPTLAIVGVSVVTMAEGQRLLPDQTVIVRQGRIAALGPRDQTAVPADADRVEAAGLYLMPALADMHAHLEHFDDPAYLQLFLTYGVTFVRSMDGRPRILEWKRGAATRNLLSPLIHTAGPVLDGNPPARADNLALGDADEAWQAVNEQADAGYDFIKIYANLSPEVYRAIIAAAQARRLPVAGHIPRAVELEAVIDDGVASIEHLGDFAGILRTRDAEPSEQARGLERRLAFDVDQTRMATLASDLGRGRTWIVPTAIQSDRVIARPDVVERWLADPTVAAVDQGMVEFYWRASVLRAGERLDEQGWSLVARGRPNRLAAIRAFHRAGVNLLVGTDTPQPFVVPGISVHEELTNFVEAGLSTEQALAAATREAARFVGQEEVWGTVEPGKRADLLLLEADPLNDIAATRRIVGLVAQGRWMPAARLSEIRTAVERVAAASR